MKRRAIAFPLSLAALALFALCGVAQAQWNTCGVGLCTNSTDQYLPVAASDNAGGTLVAWADHRSATASGTARWFIYAQRLDRQGFPQWASDGVQVAPDTARADSLFDQQNPAIIADGSGGAYIAWVDKHDYPSTDIYLQHLDASGTPAWATSDGGLGVCKAPRAQTNPVLVQDGAGGVIVVWQGSDGTYFDIFAQRVSAAGVPQWIANGVTVSNAARGQARPRAVADGSNGAFIAWQDERYISGTSGSLDVFVQRIDGSGLRQLKFVPVTGVVNPDSMRGVPLFGSTILAFNGDQRVPELILDGAGGVIVTCEDSRGATNPATYDRAIDIFAQRMSGSGTLLWTTSGVAVSTNNNEQRYPVLCTDGAGGTIITWHDYRKGANFDSDVYAQRINASGALQWGTSTTGVALYNLGGDQSYPNVVPDDLGGGIITWYDTRGASPNIYAQRLDPTGVAQWTAGGVAICGTPYGPYAHSTIADGLGGAIVAWQDGRTTNTDIYAARVNGGGGLGAPSIVLGVGDAAGTGLVLGAPSPNPTSREMSVRFVLPSGGPAVLELLDVTGRLVEHHEVGGLGPGAHVIQMGRAAALRAGLYFVRLRQNGRSLFAKATVIP